MVVYSWTAKEGKSNDLKAIYTDYPNHIVYVMSDVDDYYKKQGYKHEGSIYEVAKATKLR